MSFFFNQKTAPVRKQETQLDLAYTLQCKVCTLDKNPGKYPKMQAIGDLKPDVYFLLGDPSVEADSNKQLFSDEVGIYLKKYLNFFSGYKIRYNYCVRCTTHSVRKPTEFEIECCKGFLESDIEVSQPKVIVGFGEVPLKTLVGESSMEDWRGRKLPLKIGKHVCWYFCIDSPASIIRKKKENEVKGISFVKDEWGQVLELDLKRVSQFLKTDEVLNPPYIKPSDYDSGISYVMGKDSTDLETVKKWLQRLQTFPKIALDIETNDELRPYIQGGKIVCIALGTYEETYVFPVEHPESWGKNFDPIKKLLKEFLYSYKGVKIVQNVKFEMEWLLFVFGIDLLFKTKWACTLTKAYLLDERKGMLNLNILCLLYYGFRLKQLGVSRSNIMKTPLRDLLLYNGRDTKFTYGIDEKESQNVYSTFNALHEEWVYTARTLAITQKNGAPVNLEKTREISKKLEEQIRLAQSKIQILPEVLQFKRTNREFNPGSPDHLTTVFRDILKLEAIKETTGGNFSTDKEVLKKFAEKGIQLAVLVEEYRELSKLKSTNVDPIFKLAEFDGYVHTEYNHIFVSTGRLSSDSPNLQNYPKRKNIYVRGVFEARPGYWLVAIDFGQIEARVIAMASKDPVFVKMTWEKYDVHKDWALRIARMSPAYAEVKTYQELIDYPEKLKKFRDKAKNKVVFPFFFGSHEFSVASALGLSKQHSKLLYDDFWKLFAGVKKWQTGLLKTYDENGYVETLTGRRRHAPLGRNKVINSPIQGTASDIVVNAMNRLSKLSYETGKPYLQPMLNVHDDLTFHLPDKTLNEDLQLITKEMCCCPFKFVNVPLSVEVSIGTSWDQMEKFGEYDTTQFISKGQ